MDSNEQINSQDSEVDLNTQQLDLLRSLAESDYSGEADYFSKPDPTYIDEILRQRRDQRERILSFSTKLSWCSFFLVFAIIACQIYFRFLHPDSVASILPDGQFQILAVSVFGQLISVIIVITQSLWKDDSYMQILTKDYDKGSKNSLTE